MTQIDLSEERFCELLIYQIDYQAHRLTEKAKEHLQYRRYADAAEEWAALATSLRALVGTKHHKSYMKMIARVCEADSDTCAEYGEKQQEIINCLQWALIGNAKTARRLLHDLIRIGNELIPPGKRNSARRRGAGTLRLDILRKLTARDAGALIDQHEATLDEAENRSANPDLAYIRRQRRRIEKLRQELFGADRSVCHG
jgi:hypothetical protein